MDKKTEFEVIVEKCLKAEAAKFSKAFEAFKAAAGNYEHTVKARIDEARKHLETLDKQIEQAETEKQNATNRVAAMMGSGASEKETARGRGKAMRARLRLEELKDEREFWLNYTPYNQPELYEAVTLANDALMAASSEADATIGDLNNRRREYIERLKSVDYGSNIKAGYGMFGGNAERRLRDIAQKSESGRSMRNILEDEGSMQKLQDAPPTLFG